MMASLQAYVVLSAIVFALGLFGVFTRRNAVGILMGLELLLNAVNINLVAFSRFCDHGVTLFTAHTATAGRAARRSGAARPKPVRR